MKNKIIKITCITVTIVAVSAVAIAIYGHKKSRMEAYAAQNNCTWHYSYYLDEEPICK